MGREAETEMKKGRGWRGGREGEEIKEVEGERLALGEKDGTRFKIAHDLTGQNVVLNEAELATKV